MMGLATVDAAAHFDPASLIGSLRSIASPLTLRHHTLESARRSCTSKLPLPTFATAPASSTDAANSADGASSPLQEASSSATRPWLLSWLSLSSTRGLMTMPNVYVRCGGVTGTVGNWLHSLGSVSSFASTTLFPLLSASRALLDGCGPALGAALALDRSPLSMSYSCGNGGLGRRERRVRRRR